MRRGLLAASALALFVLLVCHPKNLGEPEEPIPPPPTYVCDNIFHRFALDPECKIPLHEATMRVARFWLPFDHHQPADPWCVPNDPVSKGPVSVKWRTNVGARPTTTEEIRAAIGFERDGRVYIGLSWQEGCTPWAGARHDFDPLSPGIGNFGWAIDARDGKPLWLRVEDCECTAPVMSSDGRLFFPCMGVVEVNPNTGDLIWRHQMRNLGEYSHRIAAAVGSDGRLYFAGGYARAYAMTPGVGLNWSVWIAGVPGNYRAVLDNENNLYTTLEAGALLRVNSSGRVDWQICSDARRVDPLFIAPDSLYHEACPTNERGYPVPGLARLSARTGEALVTLKGKFPTAFARGDGDSAFVLGGEQTGLNDPVFRMFVGHLHSDGTFAWRKYLDEIEGYHRQRKPEDQLVRAKDGSLYFADNRCRLYALDRQGELKWWYRFDRPVASEVFLGGDGTVYVHNAGWLYALRDEALAAPDASDAGDGN